MIRAVIIEDEAPAAKKLRNLLEKMNDDVSVVAVLDSIEALLDAIAISQYAGFKRVKLKFKAGWGSEMVQRVRERFPSIIVHVDCNSGFSLQDMAMFEQIDGFGLAMIEQPLAHDDIVDHARLQAECLDRKERHPRPDERACDG